MRFLNCEVVLVDLGPELHLLDLDVPLVLPRLGLALGLLVEELPGVHDPADRRCGGGRDLHQVEPLLLGEHERLAGRHDPELRAVLVDDADFLRADAVVDADRPPVYETPPGSELRVPRRARAPPKARDTGPETPRLRSQVARLAMAHGDAAASTSLSPTTSM